MSWTQAICADCWFDRFPGREPVRFRPEVRESETCCDCGRKTRSGIYVRADPTSVNFPRAEEE